MLHVLSIHLPQLASRDPFVVALAGIALVIGGLLMVAGRRMNESGVTWDNLLDTETKEEEK